MLILSRKLNESVIIDGHIIVKIMRISHDMVKIGVQAPAEVEVHRQEVFEAIRNGKPLPGALPGTDGSPDNPFS